LRELVWSSMDGADFSFLPPPAELPAIAHCMQPGMRVVQLGAWGEGAGEGTAAAAGDDSGGAVGSTSCASAAVLHSKAIIMLSNTVLGAIGVVWRLSKLRLSSVEGRSQRPTEK